MKIEPVEYSIVRKYTDKKILSPKITHPRLQWKNTCEPEIIVKRYRDVVLILSGNKKEIISKEEALSRNDLSLDNAKCLKGLTLNMVEPGGSLFSHWIFDCICKAPLVQDLGFSLTDFSNLIVNVANRSYHHEALNKLGVDNCKIIERNRDCGVYVVSDLIDTTPIRNNMVTSDWQIEFIRSLFLTKPAWDCYKPPKEKIFINRKKGRRSVYDSESEISVLKSRGFKILDLESISITDAASIFSSAKCILGPHGAGFSNIVFSRPGTRVLESFSKHISPEFYFISHEIGSHHEFAQEPDENNERWYNTVIDYTNDFVDINSAKVKLTMSTTGHPFAQ